MTDSINECGLNFLSFERALELVPPEYHYAYDWFQEHEGEHFDYLPMGDHAPSLPINITLARQAGIHTPSYELLESKGAGKERYVLFVHSEGSVGSKNAPYPDMDVIARPDGTWTFDYCAHKPSPGKSVNQSYNSDMMNNMTDGVPVAVYVKGSSGYTNYGLAFVERYDPITDMFTLHGPVSAGDSSIDFWSVVPPEQLTDEERSLLLAADSGDNRMRVRAELVRREKQSDFRRQLINAYSGTCAVTGIDVLEVLQAAHIDPYRGRQSQVVSNGLLLRSDIHLLYDAHLITVLPETYRIRIGKQLENTSYGGLDGKRINVPEDPSLQPNNELLDMHVHGFESIARRTNVA